MGWFWQSSASTPKPEDSSTSTSTPAPPPEPTQSPTPPPGQSQPSADQEVAAFMQMFVQDAQPSATSSPAVSSPPSASKPTTPPSSSSSSPSSSWLRWPFSKPTDADSSSEPAVTTIPRRPTRSPQSLAMSEHCLPSTMSCRDAFDYAWHCHTPGSQWNAVYRYGSVRTCSELWDDFWFCMRTKSYSPEMRAEAIRQHYRAKEETKYAGRPSSEDVWESRDERVPPGTAFRAQFEPPIVDDTEFRRADAERRRRIREMAGIDDGRDSHGKV